MMLIHDLSQFEELNDLRLRVMDGDFDESPDEEDKALLKSELPENFHDFLGL